VNGVWKVFLAKAFEQQNDPEKFHVIRHTSIYLSALDFVILVDHVTSILLACSPSISNHAYALIDLILTVTETYLEDQVFKCCQDAPTTVFYAVQSYKKRCLNEGFPQSLFNIVSRFKDVAENAMTVFGDPNLNTVKIMKLKNSIDWALINPQDLERLQKTLYFKHFLSRVRVTHFEGLHNYKSGSKICIARQFQIYKYLETERAACYFSKKKDEFLGDSYAEQIKLNRLLLAQEIRDNSWEVLNSVVATPKASSSLELRSESRWLSSKIPTEDGPNVIRRKLLAHQCRDGFEEDFDDDFVTPELLRQLEEEEEEEAARVQTPLLELTEAEYDELNSAQDVLFSPRAPVATRAEVVVGVAVVVAPAVVVAAAAEAVAADAVAAWAEAVVAVDVATENVATEVVAAEAKAAEIEAEIVAAEAVQTEVCVAAEAAAGIAAAAVAAWAEAGLAANAAAAEAAVAEAAVAEAAAAEAAAVEAAAKAVATALATAEAVMAEAAAAVAAAEVALAEAAVEAAAVEAAAVEAAAVEAAAVVKAAVEAAAVVKAAVEAAAVVQAAAEAAAKVVVVAADQATVPGGVKRALGEDQQQQQQQQLQPAHKYYIVDPSQTVIVSHDTTLEPNPIFPTSYDDAIIVFAVPRNQTPRKITIGGLTFTV
jgi:hypothetical protein